MELRIFSLFLTIVAFFPLNGLYLCTEMASFSEESSAEELLSPKSLGIELVAACRNKIWKTLAGKMVIEDYLSQQPDLDACDDKGSALMWACRFGNRELAYMLVEHGASLQAVSEFGYTPLRAALDRGDKELVYFLLKMGALVEAQTADGATALHLAAMKGYLKITRKIIIKNPSLLNLRTSCGYTPLHYAAQQGHDEIVSLLLSINASHEIVDCIGRTPLHLAVWLGHIDAAQRLLFAGADPNARQCGKTSLDVAEVIRHTELIDILRAFGAVKSVANCYVKSASGVFDSQEIVKPTLGPQNL